MGNASVDDTDAATTFFFTTDAKTYSCSSILIFVILANIDRLYNSSIYVLQRSGSRHDTAARHNFVDTILNTGGSNSDDNDATERFVCSFVNKL
jgi:hypothetical protein